MTMTAHRACPRYLEGTFFVLSGVLKLKLHVYRRPFIIWLQWPPLSLLHFIYPVSSVHWMNKLSSFFEQPCLSLPFTWKPDPSAFFLPVDFTVQPKQHPSRRFFPDSRISNHSVHWSYFKKHYYSVLVVLYYRLLFKYIYKMSSPRS